MKGEERIKKRGREKKGLNFMSDIGRRASSLGRWRKRGSRLCMVDRQRQVSRQRGEEALISGSKSPDPRYGTTDQNQLKNKINIHTGVPSPPLPFPLSLLPLYNPSADASPLPSPSNRGSFMFHNIIHR